MITQKTSRISLKTISRTLPELSCLSLIFVSKPICFIMYSYFILNSCWVTTHTLLNKRVGNFFSYLYSCSCSKLAMNVSVIKYYSVRTNNLAVIFSRAIFRCWHQSKMLLFLSAQ